MKKINYIILILIVVFSCKNEVIEKPKNLIKKDKMIAVLYDIELLNAAKNTDRKVLEKYNIMPLEYLYKKHEIDSLQFAMSSNYYASKPEVYVKIYSAVQTKLETVKKELDEAASAEKKKQDSIRKDKKSKGVLKKDKPTLQATDSISK